MQDVTAESGARGQRAPFPRWLRRNFEGFQERYEKCDLGWDALAEALRRCGVTGRGGSVLTGGAVRVAYQRERKRRRAPVAAPRQEVPQVRKVTGPAVEEVVQAVASAPGRLRRLASGVE